MSRGFEEARRVTARHAKSFYFASRVLDRETADAAFATYAFCRRCDDAVDEPGTKREKVARLDALVGEADSLYAGHRPSAPILAAFQETVRTHRIPEAAVRGLLEGMRWDVEGRTYRTWEETLAYCELAAGTVGRMMAALFRADPRVEENAAALGRAMQLTNIVRDVGADLLSLDRLYLPEEGLVAEGLDRAALRTLALAPAHHPALLRRFSLVAQDALARADRLYEEADRGVAGIPSRRARAAVVIMRATYSTIGRVIEERAYDVFSRRNVVSPARKVEVASRALVRAFGGPAINALRRAALSRGAA